MARSLNILHILRAPVGGLFRHVLDLALEQTARGHNVGLLADATSGDGLASQRLADIAPHLSLGVHLTPMTRGPSLSDASVIKKTGQLIKDLNVDVLHGHGAKGGLYARLGGLRVLGTNAHLKQPKRFYTPHGGTLHYTDSFLKGAVFMGIETVLDQFSDGLIFESRYARQTYEEGLGRPKSKTKIIANGLRPSDFESVPVTEAAAEFLYVGELRQLKGVDVLLHALAKIEGDPAPKLVIVGDGPDRQEFEQLVLDLGLTQRVKFTGVMPVHKVFPLGRIMVMPSRAESLPYVALEAAAAGKPLIATRVGGVPEIVWGTDTELVPPDDVNALQSAMISAISDQNQMQARAKRLRDSVANRFTVSTMTSSVLDFYEETMRSDASSLR